MANQIYFLCHTIFFSYVQQLEILYTKMCFRSFVSIQISTLPNRCIIQKYSPFFQKFSQTEIIF